MVDVKKLIKEFSQADMQAYIEQYNMGDLAFGTFFPSKYTPDLTFESLQAATGAKVAAPVVSFNSRAPRAGRPTVGKVVGDIPKIELARVKDERDINTYRQLLGKAAASRNPAITKAIIDWIYEDTKFTLDSVNARIEWLSKQAASNGRYELTMTNNELGVVTKVPIEFGIPTANRKNATAPWANPATAKPITDTRAMQQAARAKGKKVLYATTDQETMDRMLDAVETQTFCASYAAVALDIQARPTVEALNNALQRNNLPTFRVWDSYVNIENKKGEQVTESGWVEGNVTFTVQSMLGDIQYTDTADGWVTIDQSVKSYSDFVLVKAYAEQDPIGMVTKGIAYATPVLANSESTWILKTVA